MEKLRNDPKQHPLTNLFTGALLSLALGIPSAGAVEKDTDYMACSVLESYNRVSILAVPYAINPAFGREQEIVVRSCSSRQVRTDTGWVTRWDCTKELAMLENILEQLRRSRACP
ncbi:MAG: hypothetical protein NDJ89_13190 [Oligoflexia bacterium]|nr:hypothetical protein [Oligoflexia bacterium]